MKVFSAAILCAMVAILIMLVNKDAYSLDEASGIPGCSSVCLSCGFLLPFLSPWLWIRHLLLPVSLEV